MNDATAKMFQLIICENYVVGEHYGLSVLTANEISGSAYGFAFQQAQTEDEFVNDVMGQAENFSEMVEFEIDKLNPDDSWYANDVAVLRDMMSWKYDEKYLTDLARKEWKKDQDE